MKATMCLFIVGNLIGAGILAMPVEIGIAGMLPSLIGLILLGGAMLLTALILSREATECKDALFNFPSLYARYLGPSGKWLAIAANILILYGMMVAYLSGGAVVISQIIGGSGYEALALIVFFSFLVSLSLGGKRLVHRANALMVILMWVAFAVILAVAGKHVEIERFGNADWGFFPFALPVILTAFWFHNIIPNVCRNLNWERKAICQVMIIAIIIGLGMYLIWVLVAVGAVPLSGGDNSLIEAYRLNLPATIPLEKISRSETFRLFTSAFALIALATSYISTALGAVCFNEDLFRHTRKPVSRGLIRLATFAPSFLIALFFPHVFIKAIDLVGGLGIAILFGILPCAIGLIRAQRDKRHFAKIGFALLFIAFILLALWQTLVEFGILKPVIQQSFF